MEALSAAFLCVHFIIVMDFIYCTRWKQNFALILPRGRGKMETGRQRDSQREGFRDLWPDSTEWVRLRVHIIILEWEREGTLRVPLELLMISQLWRRSTPLAAAAAAAEWLNERLRGIIGVAFNLISQLLRSSRQWQPEPAARKKPFLCHKELSKLRGGPDDRRKDGWTKGQQEGETKRVLSNPSRVGGNGTGSGTADWGGKQVSIL